MHVRYLGRPKGTVVRAEARVMRAGRQLIVVECRVTDDLGNTIAFADFAGMIVPLRQPLRPEGAAAGDAHVPDL
jgi:acyl-coenzyme A thioesterase PaaI-like protein